MAEKAADQVTVLDITDAYSVMLTSEAYTFPGSTTGALAGSTTTQVIALIGSETATATVTAAEITCPTGLTATVNANSGSPIITITAATSFASAGNVTIPVHVGDVTVNKVFSAAVALKGATGSTGSTGTPGKGISNTAITYQAGSSGTTAPTGTWVANPPAVTAGQYLWTKTVLTYTDSSTATAYSVGMMGATGATGNTGAAGKGVSSTAITYQMGTSGTTAPTGTWSATIPAVSASQYLWTRTIITYTDATTSTSYAVGMMGATGAKGDTGNTGAAGAAALTLAVTSSAGLIFKNSDIATILTAHVYKAGAELTGAALTAEGTINWYKDGSTTPAASGSTLTITAGDVTNRATYVAKLEDWAMSVKAQAQVTLSQTVDVASVTRYYLLQSSTLSAPAKPTDNPPTGWMTTEPSYSEGATTSLYTCELTLLSDASWSYSDVSLSASFEAAKSAYNKATAAQSAAIAAQTFYCASNTAAATAAKAPASTVTDFALANGASVVVKFTYANTAASPTLNINGTGAKAIRLNGAAAAYWTAGATVQFVYDGVYWQTVNVPLYGTTATIGNPAGGNVYVDGSSMEVRSGATALARFKAALVEIGLNAASAVIKMCGGQASIRYESGTGYAIYESVGSVALLANSGSVMMGVGSSATAANDNGIGMVTDGADVNALIRADNIEAYGEMTLNGRSVMSSEIIFDSSDGSVAGSETMSKSAALFDELTFFFSPSTSSAPHMSSSVKSPDGKKAILSGAYLATESIVQYSTITYAISGTTITRGSPYYVNFGSNTGYGAVSNVRLLRIVGHIYG